jgi:hypothetical protein
MSQEAKAEALSERQQAVRVRAVPCLQGPAVMKSVQLYWKMERPPLRAVSRNSTSANDPRWIPCCRPVCRYLVHAVQCTEDCTWFLRCCQERTKAAFKAAVVAERGREEAEERERRAAAVSQPWVLCI